MHGNKSGTSFAPHSQPTAGEPDNWLFTLTEGFVVQALNKPKQIEVTAALLKHSFIDDQNNTTTTPIKKQTKVITLGDGETKSVNFKLNGFEAYANLRDEGGGKIGTLLQAHYPNEPHDFLRETQGHLMPEAGIDWNVLLAGPDKAAVKDSLGIVLYAMMKD